MSGPRGGLGPPASIAFMIGLIAFFVLVGVSLLLTALLHHA